jgi:hypothetical protein
MLQQRLLVRNLPSRLPRRNRARVAAIESNSA